MIRTNLYVKREQLATLKALSGETGAPVAALIRKAIDEYLKAQPPAKRGTR
jgi:predicted DNA-binding protein